MLNVTLPGVGAVKDSVSCDFTAEGFDLKVMGLEGVNYRLLKDPLEKEVEVGKCRNKMVQEGPDDGDGAWLRERFPGFRPSRRGDWDKYPYVCMCYSDHGGSHECGPEVETEKTDCSCLGVASQGVCKRWYCREYDDAGLHDVEHEYYDATQLSSSGSRVDAWRGDIDSRGEFEMSECICTVPSANDMLCEKWECFEKGTAYFFPNLWWSALHVTLIILGPVFVFALADEETSGPVVPVECGFCCYGLFVLFAYPILFVWVGGIGELVIVISIFAPCLCCLGVVVSFAEPEEKDEGEAILQQHRATAKHTDA